MIVDMAQQYVRTVPHVAYTGVGINPKGDVSFRTEEASRKYIMEKLIARGPWQNYGQAAVSGSATFVFQLETAKLFLTVQEARRRKPDGALAPVIVFSGNFHYDVSAEMMDSTLKVIGDILHSWRICWTEYTKLVDSVFISKEL